MNLHDQLSLFESKYSSENIFESINQFIDDSNKLYDKYQGRLDHSECLSAVLTENFPADIDSRKFVLIMENTYYQRYINEVLTQIDDLDVKISISQTLKQSIAKKSLTFIYLSKLSNSQRSRVRIVSKMIWSNLYPDIKKGI